VNSWRAGYEGDLYGLFRRDTQGKELALELAELFVGDLNRELLKEFRLARRPDEEWRQDKAPDFLYKDAESELCAVFEVTRALDERATQRNRLREDFLEGVRSCLGPSVDGDLIFFFQQVWPGSNRLDREELAELSGKVAAGIGPWVDIARQDAHGGHRLDLSPLLPAVVRRFDFGAQRLYLSAVPVDQNVNVVEEYLLPVLSEANCKLRTHYDRGCETFLLLDCRLMEALNVGSGDIMDCSALPHVQHVLAFDVSDSGVGVVPLWQAAGARLALPLPGSAWIIQPPGWYGD